jgi:hypothetical protein
MYVGHARRRGEAKLEELHVIGLNLAVAVEVPAQDSSAPALRRQLDADGDEMSMYGLRSLDAGPKKKW